MRADAVRNRATILATARSLIADLGPDVAMEDIASKAGVAVGTLYRHFPSKDDLVAAVMGDYIAGIATRIDAALNRARGGASPGQQIITLLQEIIDDTATLFAIKSLTAATTPDRAAEHAATDALSVLIDLARTADQVAADLTVADVYLVLSTAPTNVPRETRARWLDLVVHGLINPTVAGLAKTNEAGHPENET